MTKPSIFAISCQLTVICDHDYYLSSQACSCALEQAAPIFSVVTRMLDQLYGVQSTFQFYRELGSIIEL